MSQSQHKYGMETKLITTFNWQRSQNYPSHKRRGVNAYIDTKYTLTLQKAWVPKCTTVKHALSVFILCRKFSATNSYKKSMVWHDINTKEVLKPKVNLEIRFLDLSPLSSSLASFFTTTQKDLQSLKNVNNVPERHKCLRFHYYVTHESTMSPAISLLCCLIHFPYTWRSRIHKTPPDSAVFLTVANSSN